ncbi:MAG: TPM domain-containing protein [Candidatus Paceibacterota bacterium]|jgi:uncharacterized protein
MNKILTTLLVWLIIPIGVFAYTSPGKSSGFVNDFAGVLKVDDIQLMNSQLSSLEKSFGVEIVVVTIPSLGDEVIETYAIKLFEEWGIGNKDRDNGLLILVAPNDRQARIEVGYGLEGTITDIQSGNIIRNVMIPAFKTGDYSSGTKGAVNAVLAILSNSPDAAAFSSPSNSSKSSGSKVTFELVIFLIFFVGSVLTRLLSKTKSWWLGGVIGAVVGIVAGLIWGFFFTGITAIIIFTMLGLIFDYIVSKNPPKSGDGHGGIFPMFFGGGGSGGFGGGGFGGFGGGMSGGGGASGRW